MLKPECEELAGKLFEIYSFANAFTRQVAERRTYLPNIRLARESLETVRSLTFFATANEVFSDPERDSVIRLVGAAKSALAREEWSQAEGIGGQVAARLLVLTLNKVCECQYDKR